MQTYCIEFLDSSGHVLDRQFLDAYTKSQARSKARSRTPAEGYRKITITAL